MVGGGGTLHKVALQGVGGKILQSATGETVAIGKCLPALGMDRGGVKTLK